MDNVCRLGDGDLLHMFGFGSSKMGEDDGRRVKLLDPARRLMADI